ETGSTIRIYASADCSGSAAAIDTAATFASPGIALSVADNSATTFTATATDAAGNTSACSSPITYTEDSTAPPAPTIDAASPSASSGANSPRLIGTAEADSTVRIYTTADCSGSPVVTGSAATFALPGITVTVA